MLYVFNTPGEYIVVWTYLSPSYEGLSLGLTQIIRLLNSVAMITMMISLMSYQTLIETFPTDFIDIVLTCLSIQTQTLTKDGYSKNECTATPCFSYLDN